MAGLRGEFATGFVSHRVNVGYSAKTQNDKTAWRMSKAADNPLVNIYDTRQVAPPANASFGGDYDDPLTSGRTRSQGWLLSDTLGVLDDTLLFTAGARHQKVVVRNYNKTTGLQTDDAFDDSRWMPTYGVVYKPWKVISLYANHTEALQPGSNAPTSAKTMVKALGSFTQNRTKSG